MALDALDLPAHSFDSAFSINVNLFWTRSPARELEILHRALRPGGALHVCFGAGVPPSVDRVTSPVAEALRGHGFTGVGVCNGLTSAPDWSVRQDLRPR
ncbi:MAG: methyltransferase domain-containing protein [Pseudonocardiaceae bacterium]